MRFLHEFQKVGAPIHRKRIFDSGPDFFSARKFVKEDKLPHLLLPQVPANAYSYMYKYVYVQLFGLC